MIHIRKKRSNNIDVYHLIGLIYIEKGLLEDAIQVFQSALKISEVTTYTDSSAYTWAYLLRNLAIAYYQLGQKDQYIHYSLKAMEYFEEIEKKTEEILHDHVSMLENIIRIDHERGDLQKVAVHLEQILRLDPANKKYRYDLACILFKLGDLDKSQRYFFQLLDLETQINRCDIYYWLILIYSKKGLSDKKREILLLGLVEQSDFYIGYKWPEGTFSDEDQEFFITYLKKNLIDSNVDKSTLNTLLHLLFELNMLEDVQQLLNEFDCNYPDINELVYWKIVFSIRKGNFEYARTLYQNQIQTKSNYFESYNWEETNLTEAQVEKILE